MERGAGGVADGSEAAVTPSQPLRGQQRGSRGFTKTGPTVWRPVVALCCPGVGAPRHRIGSRSGTPTATTEKLRRVQASDIGSVCGKSRGRLCLTTAAKPQRVSVKMNVSVVASDLL